MNRSDLAKLMEAVEKELTMPGGNFDSLYGHDEKTLEQARLIAAVSLTAVDKYYTELTKQAFLLREHDEHVGSGKGNET